MSSKRQIQSAIRRYQEEGLSLAKAAELARVSWAQMREILLEQGIQPALGPATLEEAQAGVDTLRRYLAEQP
jgi:predicted HTH domain antitoxin